MKLKSKHIRLAGLVALFTWASFVPALAHSKTLKEAIGFYQKGDYASVIDKLKSPEKLGKDVYVGRYYRALAYQKLNKKKLAVSDLKWLYYNSKDKQVQYKAWQALRNQGQQTKALSAKATAYSKSQPKPKDGVGADAWITPKQGYGRSGPPAYSKVKVKRFAKPCGH